MDPLDREEDDYVTNSELCSLGNELDQYQEEALEIRQQNGSSHHPLFEFQFQKAGPLANWKKNVTEQQRYQAKLAQTRDPDCHDNLAEELTDALGWSIRT